MTPKEIAEKCLSNIVDDNLDSYSQILNEMDETEIDDEYWLNVLRMRQELDEENRKTLTSVMRQVSIDTVASLLAVIDGIVVLDGQNGTFELSYRNGAASVVSGELSDLFLETVENAE